MSRSRQQQNPFLCPSDATTLNQCTARSRSSLRCLSLMLGANSWLAWPPTTIIADLLWSYKMTKNWKLLYGKPGKSVIVVILFSSSSPSSGIGPFHISARPTACSPMDHNLCGGADRRINICWCFDSRSWLRSSSCTYLLILSFAVPPKLRHLIHHITYYREVESVPFS